MRAKQTRTGIPDLRPTLAAAVTACAVILLFGVAHRLLSARMSISSNMPPLDPAVLNVLPMQIGDWSGQDVPVDDAVARATSTDACINRRYSNQNRSGLGSVSLFIGCGTDVDNLMSHRPLGCYKYAGWTLTGQRSVGLPLADGTFLPCTIYTFYREGTASESATVLHYCTANGQYFDEVMKVRALGLAGLRSLRYAAQVQIIAMQSNLADDSAIQVVSDFAVESAGPIGRLFDAIDRQQIEIQSGTQNQGNPLGQ